jgi:hypothetical protein
MIDSLCIAPVALTLSGGVLIVVAVFALGFLAIVFSYFTGSGTGWSHIPPPTLITCGEGPQIIASASFGGWNTTMSPICGVET